MLSSRTDYFPYVLSGLVAVALFLLVLLDRRFPLFASSSSMVPFLFIVFASVLVLARYTYNTVENLPDKKTSELWVPWYRLGIVGGTLSGIIYSVTYWAYDWPAPNRQELSERRIVEMCELDVPIAAQYIEQGLPNPWTLFLPGIFFGIVVGMLVGLTFPRWRNLLDYCSRRIKKLAVVKSPLISAQLFGIVCGSLLGIWLGPYFYSYNDGRPLMRLSTVSVATFLSISFYLIFEIARHRNVLDKDCYRALTNVLIIGGVITGFVWMLDTQLSLSTNVYCLFYDEWDTVNNTLRPGWKPIAMGAMLGSLIGCIVMSLVSGYLVIRSVLVNAVPNNI